MRLDPENPFSSFGKSRWFIRGWTLQEIIAPSDVIFYSESWCELGKKSTLPPLLSGITGISQGILSGEEDVKSASVAKRMSWASTRATTRVEDIVYCLMGLFDVNMPLLYGEGEKAFIRLQEEIIKNSDDHSLFTWKDADATADCYSGLLAKSPVYFLECGNIIPFYRDWEYKSLFAINNRGLHIDLPLVLYLPE